MSADNITLTSSEKELVSLLGGMSMPTWIVGGWVRDKLLGLVPVDMDLVIADADPSRFVDELKLAAGKLFQPVRIIPQSKRYTSTSPTISIRLGNGNTLDVTRLRTELYEPGNRMPVSSSPATLYEDALRRDLTINALYYSPTSRTVSDPLLCGLGDLHNRRARIPRDDVGRFVEEDPIRVLRIIRFYASLGLTSGIDNIKAQITNPVSVYMRGVSIWLVWRELHKILIDAHSCAGLRLLDEFGLLGYLFPQDGVLLARRGTCDNYTESEHLAGLLLYTSECRIRKAIPRKLYRRVFHILLTTHSILNSGLAVPNFSWLCWLEYTSRALSSAVNITRVVSEARITIAPETVRSVEEIVNTKLPVSGADLLALGFTGRDIGLALDQIRGLFYSGVRTKKDLLERLLC